MNSSLQKKVCFWELAALEDDDVKITKMWNMLFGGSFSSQRRRMTAFLEEVKDYGNAEMAPRMTARKVGRYLQVEGEEEEVGSEDDTATSPANEASTSATGTTTVTDTTATITTSLANAVANIDIGQPPPRAAARAMKKLYWDVLRPIVHRAADQVMADAEELWRQKLQGPKENLVSTAQSVGTTSMWEDVKAITLPGVRWRYGSFTDEGAQVTYTKEVFRIISTHLHSQLHIKILDTHSKGMRDPPCRPDVTLTRANYEYTKGSNIH